MDTIHGLLFPKKLSNTDKGKNQKGLIFILVFLFTLHLTPATYVEAVFLENLTGSDKIGLIYAVASIITIVAFALVRKIIKTTGNYKTFLSALIIEIISLAILSLSLFVTLNSFWIWLFIIMFIIGFTTRSIAFFNFDIFIEHLSKDHEAGSVRGAFLTSGNIAFVIGPMLTGLMVFNIHDIGKVFFLGILLLIPVIHITVKYFKHYEDTKYKDYEFLKTFFYVLQKTDLRRIFICNFLLYLFYSWMIIYTPIYLNQQIGFDLGEVTIIIGIALIPFLVLQMFLGKIADSKYGEKEILTLGFIITGITTILMTFFSAKIFILWTAILFATRIGASMIETMVETYTFKKLTDKNLDTISMFRVIRPMAYVIGPVTGSILLIFMDIKYLFLILGIIMIFGIKFSLKIKDTL